MSNHSLPTPTEADLIKLLENIQPQPEAHLRTRVANATWASSGSDLSPAPEQRQPAWFTSGSLRRSALAALAVIGVLIVFFAIPPFNGVAKRVADFFYRKDQNTIPITLTAQLPSRQFPLSVVEAASRAGFPVHQPGWLPESFQLNGAAYDPDRQAVLLDYYSPSPGKFLRLTQSQAAENRMDIGSIGASAEVQMIDIHTLNGETVTGEYVTGAWRIPSVLDHLQTGQPDMTATMQANWDPEAKIHMLRWLSDGILYEIIHADQTLNTLSSEMLVKIAESIK